ncbi:BTB/POZ domain-containing protein POB1 [Triticum urartu]|uniref:BTB/POZ domain-containing protein POB1 n=2 Tax=Triticum urartu TaxID=4572 RepID=M8AKY3_TRIUA|nr:BTB/POZ domain-containing protein POB1 [Triticum urartu]
MAEGRWKPVIWMRRKRLRDDAPTEAEAEAVVGESFEFAFDNEAFSDRVLRVEVVGSEEENGIFQALMEKLFSNGMKESDQRHATLTIADSEEKAFMALLHLMYTGKLTPTTESTLLVDMLMAADKFEVVSCMKLCSQRLIDLPMTLESAVRCLDLPCTIPLAAAIREAAKTFFAETYKEFLSTKFQDELMRVPLAGIQAILSRNRLGIVSEGDVYEFMLRWACSQYSNSEERHKILSSRLLPLVPRVLSMNDSILIDHPSGIVNFTIKREKCYGLFPLGSMRSPPFHCAGRRFYLSARCMATEQLQIFGLSVNMLEDKGAVRGTVDYKIGVKTRPSLQFVTKHISSSTTDSKQLVGCRVPWSELIADDNPYFIDDKLHLQVHVKITPQTE